MRTSTCSQAFAYSSGGTEELRRIEGLIACTQICMHGIVFHILASKSTDDNFRGTDSHRISA